GPNRSEVRRVAAGLPGASRQRERYREDEPAASPEQARSMTACRHASPPLQAATTRSPASPRRDSAARRSVALRSSTQESVILPYQPTPPAERWGFSPAAGSLL